MSKRVPFDRTGDPVRNPDYAREHTYTGDGKPDCPNCGGRGMILLPNTSPPSYQNCRCVMAKLIARDIEAGWKGLMKAKRIQSSPLGKYLDSNLWVRGRQPSFQRHLKYVAIRRLAARRSWYFKVVSDADLVQAWLATTVLQGGEIFDPDLQHPSLEHLTLVDLVLPPDLLIVHLGVKRAANKEMSSVLYEALSTRHHEDKPTWIFDQPYNKLQSGHLCYDPHLIDSLEIWGYTGPMLLGRGGEDFPEFGVHEIEPDPDEHEIVEDPVSKSAGSTGKGKRKTEERDERGGEEFREPPQPQGRDDSSMGLLGGSPGEESTIRYSSDPKPQKKSSWGKGKGKKRK